MHDEVIAEFRLSMTLAGGDGLGASGCWSDLLHRDALPGNSPWFLAFPGPARRWNERHALAQEAHPAHLITLDAHALRAA